ncbi:NAD(P)/FAD-dependent oxidoreductase [Okibacterium endophyticum]
MNGHYDVVVVGAGPAGLSAALNLVRARRRVLVLDSNRPRHAATMMSHGFLTRDGIPPLELRRLGREEVQKYETAEVQFAFVQSISANGDGFRIVASGVRGDPDRDVTADRVVAATGLTETLPQVPGIRAFYGTSLHSCFECDGYEKQASPLALIGETNDLTRRAIHASLWTDDLIVFTNGEVQVGGHDESLLAERGIRVEHRRIDEIEGDRSGMTGVRLADGETIACSVGFVRPVWHARLDYLDGLGITRDEGGLVVTDDGGRTGVAGLYAVGDITPPGPEQLIIAAGSGARVSRAIVRDIAFG